MEANLTDLTQSLPLELWLHVLRPLSRADLLPIRCVNKRSNEAVKYEQQYRPRLSLVDTVLNVLVVGSDASGRAVLVDRLAAHNAPHSAPNAAPQRAEPMRTKRVTLRDSRAINLFDIRARQAKSALIYAAVADVVLCVVHCAEWGHGPISALEALRGCWCAMNVRTTCAVIAVNLDCEDSACALDRFNAFKSEHAPRFEALFGTGARIVPCCLTETRATNVTAALGTYPWCSGDILSLLSTYLGQRNNSAAAYRQLADQSLRMQLLSIKRARGLGTLVAGRVTSGTLRQGQTVILEPGQHVTRIHSLQRSGQQIEVALPGDLVSAHVTGLSSADLSRRLGLMHAPDVSPDCTLVLRARLRLVDARHLQTNHGHHLQTNHGYYLHYGTARVYCVLWWLHVRESEAGPCIGTDDRSIVREQRRRARDSRCVDAILVPLVTCYIDRCEDGEVEGDHRGRVMLVQQWHRATTLVAQGWVQHVLTDSAELCALTPRTRPYYRALYAQLVRRSSELFESATEHEAHALFAQHIARNDKARRAVERPHRYWK